MISPNHEPGSPALTDASTPAMSRETVIATANAATANRAESSKRVGITANIGNRRAGFTYQPTGSVEVREDEMLAREWGCKVSTAHQRKLRSLRDVVDVVLVKRKAQALDSLAGYTLPIESAMAAHPQPDAVHRECLSDAEEDVLQALFNTNPCEVTARHLLRKRAVMRAAALDHDREIAAKFGITL